MKLAIVVPALNEEAAIAGTLRMCLDARQHVVDNTHIDEMEIVFVNDGSTDRTQEIVEQPEFSEVTKVRFEKNRGYGAAIKAGWQATDADLVGFIDGDGTCNARFCVDMLNQMKQHDADVVLAARLSPETKMPLIRQIGNRLFAGLLGIVSGKDLTDSASGFRIVKRDSLRLMSPLPDGLHFTPAMSCICLLDPRLKIHEVHGMLYKEREGRSKLSVVRDGFRFLFTILFSACCYSPIKTMLGAVLLGTIGLGAVTWLVSLFSQVDAGYLWQVITPIWVILVCLMLNAGVLAHQLNWLLIGPRSEIGTWERALQAVLNVRRLITGGSIVTVLGLLGTLLAIAFQQVSPVTTNVIWLYIVTAAGLVAVLDGILLRVIWAVGEKQRSIVEDQYRFTPEVALHRSPALHNRTDPHPTGGTLTTA